MSCSEICKPSTTRQVSSVPEPEETEGGKWKGHLPTEPTGLLTQPTSQSPPRRVPLSFPSLLQNPSLQRPWPATVKHVSVRKMTLSLLVPHRNVKKIKLGGSGGSPLEGKTQLVSSNALTPAAPGSVGGGATLQPRCAQRENQLTSTDGRNSRL